MNRDIDMNAELGLTELRKAVVNDPRNAELRYLLGAEMAQQKDYDGAVMEMSAALALNPLMHVARFQLGLLHLTMARADHATAVLAPLEELDDGAALKHFKRGLDALIKDDFGVCIHSLRLGMELNTENEPLNRDMNMLLGRVLEIAEKIEQPVAPATFSEASASPRATDDSIHTDFSLYDSDKH